MTTRASLVIALSMAIGMPVAMAAGEPAADAAAPDDTTVSVALRGPFGTVAGTDPEMPATAAPDGRALDTWQREATMEVVVEPPLDATASLTLQATPFEGDAAVELPVVEGRWVTAPEMPGEHLVLATVMSDEGRHDEYAWLLEVPDRPAGIETLLSMPPVEAGITAASGTAMGVRGHGCYVDMCQEVGFRPPATTLEPLIVTVGEPVALGLDDGSAMIGWEGRLEPRSGTGSETRFAEATFDKPADRAVLTGLEPDEAGEWLLELRADYDRERGWQWYLFRIVAE